MARATTPSLLSLDRAASLLGLDPLHFSGGYSHVRIPLCADVWRQYDWQDADKVSREHFADKIAEAERDIADILKYWPAPVWIVDEWAKYPQPRQPDMYGIVGLDARDRAKSVTLEWSYFITGGQRATEFLSTETFTTLDLDADGFNETAQFTLTVDADLDTCEVHAYFKEYSAGDAENCRTDPTSTGADQAWEIYSLKTSLSGTTLTVYIPVWNLFKPQLSEGSIEEDINADVATNYVDAAMFYRVYTDPETQAQFLWGSDVVCEDATCAWATQDGCIRTKDPKRSIVVPQPGTYDATTETFAAANWSQRREPDSVRFWYRCGYRPIRDAGCVELDQFWAETILILAVARLDMPICDNCSQAAIIAERWRHDLSMIGTTTRFQPGPDDLNNPLGPRYGEAYVWRRLKQRKRKRGKAVII